MMYVPDKKTLDRIENNFQYHPPQGNQAARYSQLREIMRGIALHMVTLCPESPELDNALTHLEEASMWANASIARAETLVSGAPTAGTEER